MTMSGEIKPSAMEAAKKFRATVIGLSNSSTEKFAQALQEYADSVAADALSRAERAEAECEELQSVVINIRQLATTAMDEIRFILDAPSKNDDNSGKRVVDYVSDLKAEHEELQTKVDQLAKQVEMDTVRFKEMQATGDKLEVELAQAIKHNAILLRQLEDTRDELDTILQVAEAAGYNNSEKIVSHFLFWMELKEDLNLDLD